MSLSDGRRTGSLVVDNIGELVTNDPGLGEGLLGIVRDAALLVVDGVVVYAGPRAGLPSAEVTGRIDAAGAAVLPGFVDSHGHLVFAGDRAAEFAARMAGTAYTAGGIASTVAATRAATDEQLSAGTARLVREAALSGTTTSESKSGYGLTVDDEARSLRVAGHLVEEVTFLGAHVVPPEYAGRPDDYVALVTGPMLDACAPNASWIDVFCDRGAFDGDQAREILRAGMARGLRPRVHANQLQHGPGVQVAVEVGAASADHVTHASDEDIEALAASDTVATLLPAAEFSTRAVYPDARRFLEAGVTVALAADCNPGSSYTTNMPFCIAVAVRELRMTPAEAVWSATAGGARALRRTDVGHLAPGARADLVLLDAPSHVHLAYRPGVPLVRSVFRAGARVR
ncbi:MAG TPA: imidazolonepropionase [Candidatus Angelobacter sp.]|nr:imidazolonepropionase [Candidatus Angelobacter sp.]